VHRGGRSQWSIAQVVESLCCGRRSSPHNLELAERKPIRADVRAHLDRVGARTETQTQGQRSLAKVIPLQGGVPIKVGEETIVASVSAAPRTAGRQEEACGKAGIAKVADQLNKISAAVSRRV